MEATYRCSAMPCVPELLGGNLAPLPADKSDWHIHQFVRVHIPWHIHQTCRLGKGCKTSLSLSEFHTDRQNIGKMSDNGSVDGAGRPRKAPRQGEDRCPRS